MATGNCNCSTYTKYLATFSKWPLLRWKECNLVRLAAERQKTARKVKLETELNARYELIGRAVVCVRDLISQVN